MNALVVGGNGFIGSHLVDRLAAYGWDVTVLDRHAPYYDPLPASVRFINGDLTHTLLLREAVAGAEIVFHLAWSTIHETSNQDPAADVKANLIPTINLIEASRQASVQRIVFTSSGGTVYGVAEKFPIPETHQHNPISAYGITKLAVEKYLEMFRYLHGLEYVVLRPSVPYGPRQDPLARQGAVAVFLHRVAHNLPVTIWGDGSVIRDYFYISDLVSALVASAERPLNQDRVFNIGGGEEVTLNRLLELVEETVERRAVIEYKPARTFDAPRIVLDTRRACTQLGWQPDVSLRDGLTQTWSWMSSIVEQRVLA